MKRIPVFICVAMLLLLSDAIMVFYQTLKEINTIEAICELEKGKDPLTTPLMVAIKAGASQRIINSFIKKTSNINAENANGFNALTTAVICATDTSIIETLIKNGADANYQNKDKLTPMQIAAKYATNPKVIDNLIKCGANIEKHATNNQNLSWPNSNIAVFEGDKDEEYDCYYAPLLIAARYNKTPIIESILKNGANPSVTAEGNNALIIALQYNSDDNVSIFLLNNGFDPNSKENRNSQHSLNYSSFCKTALLLSADRTLPLIKTLIEHGANTNDLDYYGNNIFVLACILNKNIDVLEYLHSQKIDINHTDQNGNNALLAVCKEYFTPFNRKLENKAHNRLNKLKYLLKIGLSVNSENNEKETALLKLLGQSCLSEYDSLTEYINLLKYLIEHGADVNHKSNYGLTPLLTAAKTTNRFEIIELLLNSGANINDTYTTKYLDNYKTKPITEKLLCSNHDNVLMCALKNSSTNEKIINSLLKTGIDINYQNGFKITPLLVACARTSYKNDDFIPIIKLLISKGANINHSASDMTPLMAAVYANDSSSNIINLLIDSGANPNVFTSNNDNLLLLALSNDFLNKEKINKLINLGQNVNYKNKSNETPILLLAKQFYREMDYIFKDPLDERIPTLNKFKTIFELLIQHGANINIKDNNGQTPFFKIAAYDTSGEIIKLFLNSGTDLNAKDKDGNTPIYEAIKGNSAQIVEQLIKTGAKINIKNNKGETPLFMCTFCKIYFPERESYSPTYCVSNPVSALEILIRNKINLNAVTNLKHNILHYFIINSEYDYTIFIEELLKQGLDIETRGSTIAITPLMLATFKARIEYAKFLIAHGANVNSRDCEGYTPFMYAILSLKPNSKDFTMLDMLIDSKANIQSKNDYNQTALTIACQDGKNPEVITYLLKHGINPRTKDSSGKTALDYLIKNPNLKDTKAYWELKQALNTK